MHRRAFITVLILALIQAGQDFIAGSLAGKHHRDTRAP